MSIAQPSRNLREELRLQWSLAWPVAIGQVAMVSMYLTDNIMVGHVSKVEMAGVATGAWWFISLYLPLLGMVRVLDPMVSQAIGAGDEHGAARGLARGAVLTAITAAVAAFGLALAGPALTFLGQPAEAIPVAVQYCRLLIPGLPGAFGFFLLRTWLQARGEMRQGNVAIVLANVVNVVLDWAFIYGHLGAPAMGGAGAAIATSVGSWFQLLVCAGMSASLWKPAVAHLRDAVRFESWGKLLPLGVPLAFQAGTEIWAFSIAGWMTGWVSSAALGAHLIAINLSSLSFNIALGFSTAAATRVGQLIGAGHGFGQTALAAHIWGIAVMSLFGLVFAFYSAPLAQLYSDDPEVIAIALQLMPVAAAFQLFDGTQAIAFGVLRGAGDVRLPTIANIVGFWLFGLPLGAYLLLHANMGAQGVWIGLAFALAIVSVLLIARVRWTVARGGFRV